MNLKKREFAIAVCHDNAPSYNCINKEFKVLKNGLLFWVADPFPIEINGELYIFAEIYYYYKHKGGIGYIKKNSDGFTKWKLIIEENYHLSFPNIFFIKEDLYICPESNESNEIYLYKCIDFPEKWEKDRVILKGGRYCDTVFWNNYVFTYKLKNERDNNDGELIIFNQENKEVSKIELNSEARRPAGRILGNNMPFQIGVPQYGSGILVRRLKYNNELGFDDMGYIYPQHIKCNSKREYDGIHTINCSDNYIVIDLAWSRINFIDLFYRLVWKTVKLWKKNPI